MQRDILLFDLDGTLVDSAGGIAQALSLLRAERGVAPVGAETVRPWISLGAETLVAQGLGPAARDGAGDLAAFRTILRGLPTDPDCLYPGVRAMLDEVRQASFVSAIVTNKPEGLSRALLADLGLATRFGAIVGGDTTAQAKPHPAPLRHALAALGATPERALFIGDSAVDAAAARGLAIPFLLFAGGYGPDECDSADVHASFAHHADLPGLIVRASR